MKKTALILSIILLLLALAACDNTPANPPPEEPPVLYSGPTRRETTEDYSLVLPREWQAQTSGDDNSVIFAKEADTEIKTSVSITKHELDPYLFKTSEEDFAALYSSVFDKFDLIRFDNNCSVADKPGLIAEANYEHEKHPVTSRLVFVNSQENTYLLVFTSLKEHYDADQAEFNLIQQSFSLKES